MTLLLCKIKDLQDPTTNYSSWIQDPQDPADFFSVQDPGSLGSHGNDVVTGSKICKVPWENENIRSKILQEHGFYILGIQDLGSFWDLGTRLFTPLRGGVHLRPKRVAHVGTPFPYLGNGWTDCADIFYVARDQLASQLTQTKDGVHLHVRTCSCAPFLYLRNGWTDCAEIR